MKKSVIGVLILLAVVVLVSPAIVGRLAEQSMDENLNWAADKSGEVKVTSEEFERGWFSSEGRHRIELREGQFLNAIQAYTGATEADELPVLVINTHLDHGLIPVTSMSRDKGSLAPGLGSAVSTLQVELPDGETVDLPGTIYSNVGLSGRLRSNYLLEPGSHTEDDKTASWDATDVEIETDPASGEVIFEGTVGPLTVTGDKETVGLAGLTFSGRQKPTKYDVAVGDIAIELDGLSINVGGDSAGGLKSLSVEANTRLDDDDINAGAQMSMAMQGLPQFGEMSYDVDFELVGADAEALGRIQGSLEGMAATQNPMGMYGAVETDLKALFASGFEISFEQLDVTLPQGTVASKMLFVFGEEDPATFDWSSLLLSTEASIDLSIPEAVMDMLIQANPNAAMAVGGGYLVKRGNAYEMKAELKKGLLTINGAPIPIPLGAVR